MGIRRVLHFALASAGVVVWGVGNLFYVLAILCAEAMERVEPNSQFGNCWSFALTRWRKHGGYLMVRAADGLPPVRNRFLKVFPVPHAIWVKHLDRRTEIEMFLPEKRYAAEWFPWRTAYYKGWVRFKDSPHDAVVKD